MDFFERLPPLDEPLTEPLLFMAAAQREMCRSLEPLQVLADSLPGWVPQRVVATALGFSPDGMVRALRHLHGQPYVWATEFENVHSLWTFDEPQLEIDGRVYDDSESYYQLQKPVPFDEAAWAARRVDVMRTAIRAKFAASAEARGLLVSTHPHPLLSLKTDTFWGYHPHHGGENMLARLLEELRAELVGAASL